MKKRWKPGVIIAAAALVILLGAAAFAAWRLIGAAPEMRVKLGLANMAQELSQYGSMLSEKTDFEALKAAADDGTIHTNTDVSVTIPDGKISNFSFGIDALTNRSERAAEYDISAGMYGFDVSVEKLAASSDTIYVSLPLIFDDTYSVGLSDLGREFNSSAWADIFDTKLPDDCSIELFREETDGDALDGLIEQLRGDCEIILENITCERIKEKKDGYAGVRLTIDKDAVNKCMGSLAEDIGESSLYEELAGNTKAGEDAAAVIAGLKTVTHTTDVVLDFYFDKKGRIVYLETPNDVELSDGSAYSADFGFLGEERALDVIEGSIYIKTGDELVRLGLCRTADLSDEVYGEDINILLQTDSRELCLAARGELSDVVKGEGFTFRVDNASVSKDGDELCYLSASVALEPSGESPELPENAVNLLGLDENGIYMLLYEAIGSIRMNYE